MCLILSAFATLLFNCFAENNLSGIITHLVFTRLIQYVQGLHGHSLVVVVKLCDQQLHAPATEELHACTEQHAEVLGSIQPARLYSETRSIVWSGWCEHLTAEEAYYFSEVVVGGGKWGDRVCLKKEKEKRASLAIDDSVYLMPTNVAVWEEVADHCAWKTQLPH